MSAPGVEDLRTTLLTSVTSRAHIIELLSSANAQGSKLARSGAAAPKLGTTSNAT
jgi:hypothetical protein